MDRGTPAVALAAGSAAPAWAASPRTMVELPTPTIGSTSPLGPDGMVNLDAPISGGVVDAATPGGHGYWLVTSGGGVFSFHAPF